MCLTSQKLTKLTNIGGSLVSETAVGNIKWIRKYLSIPEAITVIIFERLKHFVPKIINSNKDQNTCPILNLLCWVFCRPLNKFKFPRQKWFLKCSEENAENVSLLKKRFSVKCVVLNETAVCRRTNSKCGEERIAFL